MTALDFLDELDEALQPVAAPKTVILHCTIPGCSETLLWEARGVWFCDRHVGMTLRAPADVAEATKRISALRAQPYQNPTAMQRAQLALKIDNNRLYFVA